MAHVSTVKRLAGMTTESDMRGRRHSIPYLVTMDSLDDDTHTASQAPDLPQINDTLDTDPMSWHHRKSSRLFDALANPYVYEVTCHYTSMPEGEYEPAEVPWLREPEIECHGVTTLTEMTEDLDGVKVVNTAGVPFEPSVMREETTPELIFRKNAQTYHPAGFQHYRDALNGDTFLGLDPYHVKINWIGGQYYKEGAYTYWKKTFILHFDFSEEGFRKRTANTGLHELLVPTAEKPIKITIDGVEQTWTSGKYFVPMVAAALEQKTEANGTPIPDEFKVVGHSPISEPRFLDPAGRAWPAGTPTTPAQYLQFKRYNIQPFAGLGIENAIRERMLGTRRG